VIGAELHLHLEATIRQEAVRRQEAALRQSPCTSVPCSPLYFLSSVPRSLLSRPISGTKPGLLNGTKQCPLSSNQDSTAKLICSLQGRGRRTKKRPGFTCSVVYAKSPLIH